MVESIGELIILTKAPRSGNGKSRLGAEIGGTQAADLAEAFLIDTALGSSSMAWRTTVHFTPAWARAEIESLAPGFATQPQSGGDLGDRMLAALGAALTRSERAVLIGSDTPGLPRRVVGEAFDALGDAPAVIGPATDGGFYLIGLRLVQNGLFDGVRWSSDSVCATVLRNAAQLGMEVTLLEPWTDVDDLASLRAWEAGISRNGAAAPATRAAMERYGLRAAQPAMGS